MYIYFSVQNVCSVIKHVLHNTLVEDFPLRSEGQSRTIDLQPNGQLNR